MQREEKHLDGTLDSLLQHMQEIKTSILSFLFKLEHEYERLNWPSFLDNFSLLSGQISSLLCLLKSDRVPVLRGYITLPLLLTPDRDVQLEQMTEGRVAVFNHEVVPDYLRTKPEPEVEEKVFQVQSRAALVSHDALQKQINTLNKISANIIDIISCKREEWESESNQRAAQHNSSSVTDTQTLIAAITIGKNLRSRRAEVPSHMTAGHVGSSDQRSHQQGYYQPMPGYHGPATTHVKQQSTVKTNIKAAAAHVHPYSRQ